jgi:predicted DNA-binding protein
MPSLTLAIRVPSEVLEQIDLICQRTEHTRSYVGRRLVEEGLAAELFGSAVKPKRAVQKAPKPPAATLEIPSCIPVDAWLEWDAYRKAKSGAAWTLHAKKLSVSRLITYWENGYDTAAIIRQSIENGWSGLFSTKYAAVGHREDLARRVQPIVEGSAEEMF